MKIEHVEDYRVARKALYPNIGEQLDAIWKTFQHLKAEGVDIGPIADAMLQQIEAVKGRCPKGQPAEDEAKQAVVKLPKATSKAKK